MTTKISRTTQPTSLQRRIFASVEALGLCWLVYGAVFGLYLRDAGGMIAFYIWSVPVFVMGWILVGVPVIAMGDRVLKVPRIALGLIGAIAGPLAMLAPFLIFAAIKDHGRWNWSSAKGNPLLIFSSVIGASGLVLYSWFLFNGQHSLFLSSGQKRQHGEPR